MVLRYQTQSVISSRYYVIFGLVIYVLFSYLHHDTNNNSDDKRHHSVLIRKLFEFKEKPTDPLYFKIQEVVDWQRTDIGRQLEKYEYPNGKYGLNISNLDELVIEKGGTPLRSVLVAGWRTGSSFTSDIINSHPATFFHAEPLLDFGVIRIRGPPLSTKALANIRDLFNCDYHSLKHHLDFAKIYNWSFRYNTRLWEQCEMHEDLCFNPVFLSKFCQLFPFQLLKVTRLALNVSQELLEDKSLGVRMVLLVRDPRGVLQSRKHLEFCENEPDCLDPRRVCDDMVSDYEVAVQLKDKYPRHFRVMRFEDIATKPYSKAKEIFEFYGLNFHPEVQNFLETHTSLNVNNNFSTYRVTKDIPFHWRNDLSFDEVNNIQSVCSAAMKLWGYALAANTTHQKTFTPIDPDYSFY